MYIYGVDPGQTTGFIIAETDAQATDTIERAFNIIWAADLVYGPELFETLFNRFRSMPPGHIVIEDFKLYPNKKNKLVYNDFPAVKVIGAVEAAAHILLSYEVQIHKQMAAIGKRAIVLPEHSPHLHGLHHAIDAYKHLRFFLLRQKGASLTYPVSPTSS